MRANGVDLCIQPFGAAGAPAILLIQGASGSMDWWEEEFCERLAAGPRHVVRYDHRDTGQSVTYEPGAPDYSAPDLVADAVGVLDALGIGRAHLVGISMGGALAQVAALNHPGRVASLTLISTSPGGGADLPGASEQFQSAVAELTAPDWSDRAAVIEYIVEDFRACAARSRPFDAAAIREIAECTVDRSIDIQASFTNHMLAEGGEPWRERLGQIAAPTLVLHGDEDPLFPYGHALALAREIPGAELICLARTGHELPRATWDEVVPAILRHTAER